MRLVFLIIWQKHEQCVEDAGDQPAPAQMWQKQPRAAGAGHDRWAAASYYDRSAFLVRGNMKP
jgi:hypothetical protein